MVAALTLRELIEATPPGTLFTREGLLAALAQGGGVPEMLTTVAASRHLGRSGKWWRVRCKRGDIDGAWQDEAGRWCFAAAAGRAYLARLAKQSTPSKDRILRGPNRQRRLRSE